MQLEFTPTPGDYKAFQKYWSKRQSTTAEARRNGYIVLALGTVLLGLAFYFHYLFAFVEYLKTLFPALVFVIILIVFGRVFYGRQLARMLPRRMTVSFADDGLHHADEDSHVVTRWAALQDIGRTAEHLFLIYGFAKSVIIPTKIFDSPQALEEVLSRLRRYRPDLAVDEAGADPKRAAKKKLWGRSIGGTLLVLICLWFLAPWRDSLELPGELGAMSYITVVTGGADPNAPLPLILDLHPLGGFPEIGLLSRRHRDFPARVVLPVGPDWWVIGYSWYSMGDDMTADTRHSAARLESFTRAAMSRYPTLGRPIVTGFSQGGSMSYALAAYYPDLFAAAVPVAGALPDEVPEPAAAPTTKVRALHGAEDGMVHLEWAQYTVEALRGYGWDVQLKTYPDRGHRLGSEARDEWNALLADFARAEAEAR